MESKLTMNDLTQIKEQAEEIRNDRNENNSVFEHCQLVLMDKLPNITQTEAEQIVCQLKKGIAMFHKNYDDCTERGYVDYATVVDKVLDDKTEEEKFNYYVNILLVIRLGEKKPEEIKKMTEKELEKIREDIVSGKKVDSQILEQLRNEALVALEDNKLMSFEFAPDIDLTINNLDYGKIRSFLADEDNALYMAVAAYIIQQNGELSLSDSVNTQMIGMAVAAGMKESEANVNLAEGKIDLPEWVKTMKLISGILLYGALLLIGVVLSVYILVPAITLFLDILGTGLIAVLVTLSIFFAASFGLNKLFNEYILEPTVAFAGELYDICAAWLHQKFVGWKTNKEAEVGANTVVEDEQKNTETGNRQENVENVTESPVLA